MEGQPQKLSIENVIVPHLGYLKVPKAFKDLFGSPLHYPQPRSEMRRGKNEIQLTYIFDKKSMTALEKNK